MDELFYAGKLIVTLTKFSFVAQGFCPGEHLSEQNVMKNLILYSCDRNRRRRIFLRVSKRRLSLNFGDILFHCCWCHWDSNRAVDINIF